MYDKGMSEEFLVHFSMGAQLKVYYLTYYTQLIGPPQYTLYVDVSCY